MASPVAAPPEPVERPERYVGTAPERIAQLIARLPRVRSVWFPTPRELRAWAESGVPLYVRVIGPDRVEIGPRVPSMWVACFSPVDELTFADGGALKWKRRFPHFTVGLLAVWWIAVSVWGALGVPRVVSGDEPAAWLAFWALLALAATAGPLVGWVCGGQHIDTSRRWLVDALTTNPVGEDW